MLQTIDHPLVADRLARLRDRACPSEQFRQSLEQIAALMLPAVTADLETSTLSVTTPLEEMACHRLARPVVLVPILRAGLGLVDGFLRALPEARVAHIGLARNDETLQPETYYFNAPPGLDQSEVILLDPMLATGGSAGEAIRRLQAEGAERLRFVCLIAAPEGVARLEAEHPQVPIYAAAVDRKLDERGYIRPGLGDAGDRIFGTCGG